MRHCYIFFTILLFAFFLCSCGEKPNNSTPLDEPAPIFPDYTDVTIPVNIGPLNFQLTDHSIGYATVSSGDEELNIFARNGRFIFSPTQWKKLLHSAAGEKLKVTVYKKQENKWYAYQPFFWEVSKDSIDSHIAYRLIEPGYELWNQMGIYQRNIEKNEEYPILENKLTDDNCMNCHSFCNRDPQQLLFHMRSANAGTYLIQNGNMEKLNTQTPETMSALVYPSWHPSGDYVAFSVNQTKQAFHMNDANRVEVFDDSSHVVVYDIKQHQIITTPALYSNNAFETFPTFSPDGKTLYFCSSVATQMPMEYKEVKYSLCAIAFDPETREFGLVVDTLFNAQTQNKSASFPRVSPDGKYLLYTLAAYGGFSIWHKDADLYMVDIETGESFPLINANSDDVESYHSWSSNSRWVVFSSRRVNGLYTMPYFVYIDEQGKARKPFLLPQKDPGFYSSFMKSYNIPEFISGEVRVDAFKLSQFAKKDQGTNVRFTMK